MEEAIVYLAIERISDLLIHEAVFLRGVRQDVEFLMAELKRMQCFLKDADDKQQQDERFRNRVAEIRDLAYDAEDVIDAFIFKVAHQGGFQGIIKRFTSIFTKPFHLHKIGRQVKAIQTKLEGISKSRLAYEIPGEGEVSSSISWMQKRLRRTYSHFGEVDVVGLEGMTKDVVAKLMTEEEEEDGPHVVSLVGMGGIGKTTLARKVYNHIDVKRHFDRFAWACISQKCMPREVLHDVLIKVHTLPKEERESIDKMKEEELIRRLFDVLTEKRYLIVLDDIWRIEDWNILKPAFPRGKKGSKILFTTRIKDMALRAYPSNSPIELPLLTEDESWRLFKRKAVPGNTMESDACSKEFEILGREMVKKCGGLPLAIVVLGGLLATKKSWAEWEMVKRSIHEHLNELQQDDPPEHGAVNGVLALSYNDLPYHLKPCFLYLGHYPEDCEISKKELIRLWIAEGFISPSLKRGELMEDLAEKILKELISRCLVQDGKRDYTGIGVKTCHIHDLLKDLCVKKAREENFFEIIQPPPNYDLPHDETLSASMARRIAIYPSKRYVCLKRKYPNLRSLLLFQNEKMINLRISKCKNFKFLRVLKVMKRDDDNWRVSSEIGHLQHLRYLELKCSLNIILPQSIGKLRNLHTLRVETLGLITAPNVLFELERLRHILFSISYPTITGRNLFSAQRFASKNIETLKWIGSEILMKNCAILSFNNIQSLGIFFSSAKDVEPILKALIELHHLRSLRMWSFLYSSPYTSLELEPLSQCDHLSKLYLQGKIQQDPHSNYHVLKFVPANIVKLALRRSEVKQDPMVVLEKLPHLRILRFWYKSYTGTTLTCSANGFLQLDSLVIEGLSKLEDWKIEEGAMPRLRSLHLLDIPNLRMFPEGLRYITDLQEMKLSRMKRSLVERIEVMDGREGEDFSKVSHIPSIQITYTKDD